MSMVLPAVVGFKLSGKLKNGVTATDLVLLGRCYQLWILAGIGVGAGGSRVEDVRAGDGAGEGAPMVCKGACSRRGGGAAMACEAVCGRRGGGAAISAGAAAARRATRRETAGGP
jgi:hypothetical protein